MTMMSCGKSNEESPIDPGWNKPNEPAADLISVASYNIKHCSTYIPGQSEGPINLEGIARAIKSLDADIVYLQEVDKNTTRSGKDINQAAKLAELAGYAYYHFFKSEDYQGGEYGIAILSRYELTQINLYSLPRIEIPNTYVGYSVLATAVVTIKGMSMTLANTHLSTNTENRIEQLPIINEKLSVIKNLVILGGDFNATPYNSTITTLDSYGFVRSGKDKNVFTIPSNTPDKEIDFICFKPFDKIEFVAHKVYKEMMISDHLPLKVTFKLKK